MNDNHPGNDPFSAFGAERTIIKPRLGKAAAPHTAPLRDPDLQFPGQGEFQLNPDQFDAALTHFENNIAATPNTLVSYAVPLLKLACTIKQWPDMQWPGTLSGSCRKAIHRLDKKLSEQDVSQADRLASKYLLCTFIDECAANTPWGGSGTWAAHSLLLAFFSETWGGEKVFQLTQKMIQNPAENRQLLQLIYFMLCLGFKGKFHIEQDGDHTLQQLRDRLLRLLGSTPLNAPLAQHWRSKAPQDQGAMRYIPFWLPASVSGGLCALVFIGFYFQINQVSDRAFTTVASVVFPKPDFPQMQHAKTAPNTGLSKWLAPEIGQGLITLSESGNRSVLILMGDGMFSSGSEQIRSQSVDLVGKVAAALAQFPGKVKVTGHTDSQPIRSIRFPSNWHLSAARATVVGNLLREKWGAHQPEMPIETEGAGDSRPLAENTTMQNRAKNRRVEITLIHST